MSRIFFFSYRDCKGPVGGGRGVTYKLYLANKRYHLLDNSFYLFSDIQFSDKDNDIRYTNAGEEKTDTQSLISNIINSGGLITIAKTKAKLYNAGCWVKSLGEHYRFSSDDIYVFHDFESAYGFVNHYSFSNTYLVYHQQGSLYSEWKSFIGRKSKLYQHYLIKEFIRVCNEVGTLAFPSKGAAESLVYSEPELNECVEQKGYKVLYNGFSIPEKISEPTPKIRELTDRLKGYTGFKFITVSALNEAKGVERIPQYLNQIKRAYSNFVWVLVGNGIKAEELKREIEKYGLGDYIYWIDQPLQHADILNLFSLTDFYILLHRFSIFDYSTIEAMAYGNIPILTPVGGNKEVVRKDTGVLVDRIDDIGGFTSLISNCEIASLKQKNIELQSQLFSEKAFIAAYANALKNT